MVSAARMRQLGGGGMLFLLLVLLCRQTGGQPCQLCDPKGGAGSCVPMTPPKGVTIDSALCSAIENTHKDYHDMLCKNYPPPKGYMYECTNPGTSNTFSCRSSCGPPLEDVGKGLSLNLLQGGGMLANFNSRPQSRGTGLFDFNKFTTDTGRGDTNFGRFGTLASLNRNNNNNNNNKFKTFNNNFNLFRNNRNPSFNLLNPRAGNFRNNLLPQTRPLPISGGITPSRSGPRLQNPQPRGSTLPNLSPSNPAPSRNQLLLNTPSLPDHRPSSSTVNDQPPPVGTLVSDSDGYNPPFPGHSAQGQDGPLSSDDQEKEGDKEADKEANSSLSGPRADSNTDENQDDNSSHVTSISPKEDGDVQSGSHINPDLQTQPDDRGTPTSQGINDGQYSSAGSSPNEANVQNQNLLAQQDPEEHSQGNLPETLAGETTSSDSLDRYDQEDPVQGSVENEEAAIGNAFKGESPAEPPYGLHTTGATYPVDLGSDEAHLGSPPSQDPEEAAGSHPDLPPPPPPPQTYLQDQSSGADSSLGSPELLKSLHTDAKELYPKTSSPNQASVLNSADQAVPGVSHEQPPPPVSPSEAVPSDPNGYSNNPEHPDYSSSQPPESYPDLDPESPQGTGQEPDHHADPPPSSPADLKEKPATENLIESSPQNTAALPASASVDAPRGDDYPEKAAPISGNSLSREVEEYGEGKKEEEQEPVEGNYGGYPVNDEGRDTTSRKDYDPANPKTSPTSYPTTSHGDSSDSHDVYNSNGNNKNNNHGYTNDNSNSNTGDNNNSFLASDASPSSSRKNDEYSYEHNSNDIDKKNNEESDNINNQNNLPPEAFKNPFKNPSSPHPKRTDHFESNPAFVGTSLFSEGFLDSPAENFHPGAVASRPREPDAVDIGGYQIFPGFQEFEKTGDTQVLGMNTRQPSNNQQNNIFNLFLQPTVNQPATQGTPPSPQTFGYRTLNPSGNPGQNLDAGGFQAFHRPSGQNGQNSAGAVFSGGVFQGGRTGGYRDGDGAFNTASASGTFHPTSRTNPSLSSPRFPPPNLPHPNAVPPTPTRTPHPRYPSQGNGGVGSFGGRSGGDAARLSGGSGFSSRQGSFNLGSGDVGSKTSSTSSSSSGDQDGPAGSFTRAGVRGGGFVGFRSSNTKDEFGFPGTFGSFNDKGFDSKTSFDNRQLSDDMFDNVQSVSSQSDSSKQPLSSSSSSSSSSSPDGPRT